MKPCCRESSSAHKADELSRCELDLWLESDLYKSGTYWLGEDYMESVRSKFHIRVVVIKGWVNAKAEEILCAKCRETTVRISLSAQLYHLFWRIAMIIPGMLSEADVKQLGGGKIQLSAKARDPSAEDLEQVRIAVAMYLGKGELSDVGLAKLRSRWEESDRTLSMVAISGILSASKLFVMLHEIAHIEGPVGVRADVDFSQMPGLSDERKNRWLTELSCDWNALLTLHVMCTRACVRLGMKPAEAKSQAAIVALGGFWHAIQCMSLLERVRIGDTAKLRWATDLAFATHPPIDVRWKVGIEQFKLLDRASFESSLSLLDGFAWSRRKLFEATTIKF